MLVDMSENALKESLFLWLVHMGMYNYIEG